jgi:uncharacterized protein YcaQ
MTRPVLSRRAVAALFVARQHLDRPLRRRLTATSLARFAEDVGGVQLDSINVVERAHHLTLWSRFGPYDRQLLERLAYRRRLLFEYWAHGACLVPIAHLAAWRRAMLDYSVKSRAWGSWLERNHRVLRRVERAIRDRGPLGNTDFPRVGAAAESGWWNWKPATHALDYLWMRGRTLVASRRTLPEAVRPGRTRAARARPSRAAPSGGVSSLAPVSLAARHGRGHGGGPAPVPLVSAAGARGAPARAAGAARLRRGRRDRVEDDAGRWYALAADVPLLTAAGRRGPPRGTALLSPFDSFLWHRERTRRLFGFDYRIEVYTPGPDRVHGYYCLPIFHDGQLIGRLDPKLHRSARRLEVRRVHFEPWFAGAGAPPAASWGPVDRDAALAGTATALRSLAAFVGADAVAVGRVAPALLAAPLRRAVDELASTPVA